MQYPGLHDIGLFITIDGTDGCGKTSMLKRLKKLLAKHHVPTVYTKEPAGTPLGVKIRQIILNPQIKLTRLQQMKLFTRARIDHLNRVVVPAISQHQLVICDRYLLSAMAYQGYYRRKRHRIYDANHVLQYNKNRIKAESTNVIPDLNIYLQGKPGFIAKRLKHRWGKADKFDRYYQNVDHLRHLQWQFRSAAREMTTPYVWVDSARGSWWRARFSFYHIMDLLKRRVR